ncbi:MAG TPA: hypothetical protein VNZ58_13235 [Thermomicrobiales bacterium]|nr:hypothetical protein [Thermomicrobiales bacterium]
MEMMSLHPFDPEVAGRYVAAVKGEAEPDAAWRSWWTPSLREAVGEMASGNESASNRLTLGLAWALASEYPSFTQMGFSLTTWEARVDRGIGMLMRPPSRLFVDAGLERSAVLSMPIRLDMMGGGMMGGAYVPAQSMARLAEVTDSHLERMAKRLHDAENDPYAVLDLMQRAISYAREQGLGLYEAQDAIGTASVPGLRLVEASDRKRMDPVLRERIRAAIEAEKRNRGFFSRFFRKE